MPQETTMPDPIAGPWAAVATPIDAAGAPVAALPGTLGQPA
jgi:hypothetical protein